LIGSFEAMTNTRPVKGSFVTFFEYDSSTDTAGVCTGGNSKPALNRKGAKFMGYSEERRKEFQGRSHHCT
jgi:hypothetical protein